MANRPHVPKFGDWSNQEQPFTVVFDNARNKRQDLYENLEKPETRTQPQAPPPTQPKAPPPTQPKAPPPTQSKPPPPTQPKAPPPKPVRDDTPRAPPPTEKPNRVRAPPADQQYGGGLYGGYGGGAGSVGNQRPSQTPPRPVQPKYNPRAGNNGRGGTTIPPFPGSLGAGENMSYTHIFDKVKEERNRGNAGGSYGGTTDNTPSRPINGRTQTKPTSSKICCFPCFRWGTR